MFHVTVFPQVFSSSSNTRSLLVRQIFRLLITSSDALGLDTSIEAWYPKLVMIFQLSLPFNSQVERKDGTTLLRAVILLLHFIAMFVFSQ